MIIRKKVYFLYGFLPNNFYFLHTKINNNKNKYKLNLKDSQLGYYLVGLIEADGSIIVLEEDSKIKPTISISFNIKDKPLAVCIKNRLGFGFIKT
jgi:LAGLIDADG endonuclease